MKIQLTAVILVNFLPKQLFLLFSRFWPVKPQVINTDQIFLAYLPATGPLWGLIASKLAGFPIGLKKNGLKERKSWIWRQGPKVFLLPPGFDFWLVFPGPFVVISNYCWIQRVLLSLNGFIAVSIFLVRWPLLNLTDFWLLQASLSNFLATIMSEIGRCSVWRPFGVPST